MLRKAFALTFPQHPRIQISRNRVTLEQIVIHWPKDQSALSVLVTWGRRWPRTSPTAHRVTAYVRRPDQMGELIGLGLRPTLEFADLFDCEVVISMLPDDAAVRDVVLGREDLA